MQQLNRVQSKVYDIALFKPDNILLGAPTGAGKTNVAVLTILHQIGLHMKDGEFDNTKYKIVFVAPMKSLVAEVVGNLSPRLLGFGITMREPLIIVTPPEKWDIVTRKSGDRIYTQMVKLLIIDGIHLLYDNKGPVLESIVSRTVPQIETTNEHIFLRVSSEGLFHFDNNYRPCPLAQQYIGITVRKPLQRFQLMKEICYGKVMAAAGKHQVHSRRETMKIRDTALANDTLTRFLKDESATQVILGSLKDESASQEILGSLKDECASQEILGSQAELVKNSDRKDLLPYGFAIHHAGIAESKVPTSGVGFGRRLLLLLLILLILSGGCVGADAARLSEMSGAECNARALSIGLSSFCDITKESQSESCCDAIFATFGRIGCLCEVIKEPEYRSSSMAGGNTIVDMYQDCNGGPFVSPNAEEECYEARSQPPPTLPPPPPPTAQGDLRPRLRFWRAMAWVLVGLIIFVLFLVGGWVFFMRKQWPGHGARGYRLDGENNWWSVRCSWIQERLQNVNTRIRQIIQERLGGANNWWSVGLNWMQVRAQNVMTLLGQFCRNEATPANAAPAPAPAPASAPAPAISNYFNFFFVSNPTGLAVQVKDQGLELPRVSIREEQPPVNIGAEQPSTDINIDEEEEQPVTPLLRKRNDP